MNTLIPFDKNSDEADSGTTNPKPDVFCEEAVKTLLEFGRVLRRIHKRLVAEGKVIEIDSHYADRNGDK